MNFDEVADELYGLAPREFVAERDRRAVEARDAGDAALAKAIRALRKPTVVAWLANQLSRRHPDEISGLLELGEELREAQAVLSGEQLRALSGQRQQVVRALVGQARALAKKADQNVTLDLERGVEATLSAALANPDSAAALHAGHLTDTLEPGGFQLPDAAATASGGRSARTAKGARAAKPAANAKTTKGSPKPTAADKRREQRRAQAERDLAEAWGAARAAADDRTAAEAAAELADSAATAAKRAAEDARTALRQAEDRLTKTRAEADRTRKARDEASKTRDLARREAEKATRRVSQLQAQMEDD